MPTSILEDRATAVSGTLTSEANTLATAIVQTAHARVTARIAELRNAIDTALVAFGCLERTDEYTFSETAIAVLTQLISVAPTEGWPIAYWDTEEAAVLAAVDEAGRAYDIVAQDPTTDDLPAAP